MSLFKLIINAAEGGLQAPSADAKTLAGVAIIQLNESEAMSQGALEATEGLHTIGKSR